MSIVDVGGIILDSPLAIGETPSVGVGNGFAFFTFENPLATFLLRFVNRFLILSKFDDVTPELAKGVDERGLAIFTILLS